MCPEDNPHPGTDLSTIRQCETVWPISGMWACGANLTFRIRLRECGGIIKRQGQLPIQDSRQPILSGGRMQKTAFGFGAHRCS